MGSLFFEDGSKEKLTKHAISVPALEAFLESYAGHLIDSRAVDSKETCKSKIGKLVSDSMDRGECSVAMMEHMMQFIQQYSIATEKNKKLDKFKQLFDKICYQLAKEPSKDLSPEMVEKLSQYKKLCDDKRHLEMEFEVQLKKPIRELLSSYMSGHKSDFSDEFGF